MTEKDASPGGDPVVRYVRSLPADARVAWCADAMWAPVDGGAPVLYDYEDIDFVGADCPTNWMLTIDVRLLDWWYERADADSLPVTEPGLQHGVEVIRWPPDCRAEIRDSHFGDRTPVRRVVHRPAGVGERLTGDWRWGLSVAGVESALRWWTVTVAGRPDIVFAFDVAAITRSALRQRARLREE
ncbi:MAG: hypothetical protein ACR2F6_00225 [Mycobacteriales bacterium]